ncbi:CCA tRNA nucleotidyltransferase [Pigmentiphaga soli]|uniref:CCA tRNA nucleotidyltransferase n=1 Tax=Pigmentiphaga soli TaxID=1007095 RepID=A0ABP8GI56_9BURK
MTPPTRLSATQGLDVYVVGGAVRDALLGLPAGDRDWVVLRATPEEMSDRGFVPVGGDFPVFLHPATHEEYALARTERKSGRGYRGFTFHTGADVTLEDDLGRRDLTINAIAQAPDGRLVDPYGGRQDLERRVLRHVGPAFAEDPVRILRLARFAARFADFSVAPETLALCRAMVESGEADALVPERVWREISRGLMQDHPSRMIAVLRDTGALARIAPGLAADPATDALLDRAAGEGLPLAGRYALLCTAAADPAALSRRLRAPAECADQARLLKELLPALREAGGSHAAPRDSGSGDAAGRDATLRTLERADALRKPQRFAELLQAARLAAPVDPARWQASLDAIRTVDAGAVAREHAGDPGRIKDAVRQARLRALSAH